MATNCYLSHACRMPHAACRMPHATCNKSASSSRCCRNGNWQTNVDNFVVSSPACNFFLLLAACLACGCCIHHTELPLPLPAHFLLSYRLLCCCFMCLPLLTLLSRCTLIVRPPLPDFSVKHKSCRKRNKVTAGTGNLPVQTQVV